MAKDLAVAPVEGVPAIRPDYLLVADSVPALIGIVAPDGAVEGVNRAVLEYFGATLEEIKRWATSKLVHPDDIPSVIASQKHSWETGERLLSEHRLLRADGVYRSEEHTSELQSQSNLVCRLLLEKKKKKTETTLSVMTIR